MNSFRGSTFSPMRTVKVSLFSAVCCGVWLELSNQKPIRGVVCILLNTKVDALAHEDLRRADYAEADYVIGSAHYLCESWQGMAVAVDGDPALLRRYVNEVYHGDGLAMASDYFDIEVQALLRDRPPIIGHFDLLRKYAASPGFR